MGERADTATKITVLVILFIIGGFFAPALWILFGVIVAFFVVVYLTQMFWEWVFKE